MNDILQALQNLLENFISYEIRLSTTEDELIIERHLRDGVIIHFDGQTFTVRPIIKDISVRPLSSSSELKASIDNPKAIIAIVRSTCRRLGCDVPSTETIEYVLNTNHTHII